MYNVMQHLSCNLKGNDMAIIRPVSSLQRKIGELTKLAKDTGEPIYLTKNGAEHLVLIDADAFEQLQKRAEKGERKHG